MKNYKKRYSYSRSRKMYGKDGYGQHHSGERMSRRTKLLITLLCIAALTVGFILMRLLLNLIYA